MKPETKYSMNHKATVQKNMCYNVCYRLIEARAVTKQLMQSIMTCLEEIKNIYTQQRSSVAQKQDI